MTIQPIDGEALRRLADAATEGPWEAIGTGVRGGDHWYVCADHEAIVSVSAQDGSNEDERQPLAAFIAASREAIPALLDALAAAEHRATRADVRLKAVERLTYASDDGTEYEHNGHGPAEGEPECPGCWALGIRRALEG